MVPSRTRALLTVLVEHFRTLDIRFKRKRIWTPERVAMGMLTLISRPCMSFLEKLISELVEPVLLKCIPPDSSFVEARQKFAKQFPPAMGDLWQRLVEHAVQLIAKSRRTIGGLQRVAVDGTWVWAPHEAGNIARWWQLKAFD